MTTYDEHAQAIERGLTEHYPDVRWAVPSFDQLMLSYIDEEGKFIVDMPPAWVPVRAQRGDYAVLVPVSYNVFQDEPDETLVHMVARAVLFQLDKYG